MPSACDGDQPICVPALARVRAVWVSQRGRVWIHMLALLDLHGPVLQGGLLILLSQKYVERARRVAHPCVYAATPWHVS